MENKERISRRKLHSLKRQSKGSKLDEPLTRINKEKEKRGRKKYQNTKCRLKGGTTINPAQIGFIIIK